MARTRHTGGSSRAMRPPSAPSQSSQENPRRKRRYRPGMRALREIRLYQRSTELLLRKLPFARVVR